MIQILLVADDVGFRERLALALERLELSGEEVSFLEAANGNDALVLAEAHRPDLVVVSAGYDAHAADPSYAFALSRLSGTDLRYTPMGVFRSVERDTYDGLLNEQLDQAKAAAEPDLAGLLAGGDTWTVY